MKIPASPEAAWPVLTFKDTMTIYHGPEELALEYLPNGHTDTDILIHFRKANLLHMGDLFFNGTYPFIDTSTGGTLEGMIQASEKALKMVDKDTKIIPGHGAVCGVPELKEFLDMLKALRDAIKPLMEAGKTLPQIVEAKPTARLDIKYGRGPVSGDLLVTMIYAALLPKNKGQKPVKPVLASPASYRPKCAADRCNPAA